MTTTVTAATDDAPRVAGARSALAAAVLGFFVVTLDAVVVTVALPSIRASLGGGVAGQQWVVDGYTLLFAALLLSAGSLSDRLGARTAFGVGVTVFTVASVLCGLAPSLGWLVVARLVQGAAAAVIMPSSLALVGQAFPDRVARGRAVAIWAMGGSVAATSGPVLGGFLSLLDWRLIFLVNIPVGVLAVALLRRTARSPRRPAPFDRLGQVLGVLAMGSLTAGAIEAGVRGLGDPLVLTAFAVAVLALALFVRSQAVVGHPMLPLELLGSRVVRVALAVGFAFMVGYFGVPFVFSLAFQGPHGLTSLETGLAFLPMMLVGLVLTPFSARLVERFGARRPIAAGLGVMTVGLTTLALLPAGTPVWVLSLVMVLVGLGGPLTMPPMTAVLLDHVPATSTGTASGALNTSRQVGGALGVAVFGALLADPDTFQHGLRVSLLLAAAVVLLATVASLRLPDR